MKDFQGREYAKLKDLYEGSRIEVDANFSCVEAGVALVERDIDGLYFRCSAGKHFLGPHLTSADGSVIGVYHA